MERLLFGKREAASALSLSVRKLDYLLSCGEIRARHVGRRVLIPRCELERFARLDRPGHHGPGRAQGADTNERAEPAGPKPGQATVSATD